MIDVVSFQIYFCFGTCALLLAKIAFAIESAPLLTRGELGLHDSITHKTSGRDNHWPFEDSLTFSRDCRGKDCQFCRHFSDTVCSVSSTTLRPGQDYEGYPIRWIRSICSMVVNLTVDFSQDSKVKIKGVRT